MRNNNNNNNNNNSKSKSPYIQNNCLLIDFSIKIIIS